MEHANNNVSDAPALSKETDAQVWIEAISAQRISVRQRQSSAGQSSAVLRAEAGVTTNLGPVL